MTINYKELRQLRRSWDNEHNHHINPFIVVAMTLFLMFAIWDICFAEEIKPAGYSLNQWANAIRKAEGNKNYGILSVKCSTTEECRQICKNTVRNNWRRYTKKDKTPTFDEYLTFLANRYCPVGASNDPKGLNVHWRKNVRKFITS